MEPVLLSCFILNIARGGRGEGGVTPAQHSRSPAIYRRPRSTHPGPPECAAPGVAPPRAAPGASTTARPSWSPVRSLPTGAGHSVTPRHSMPASRRAKSSGSSPVSRGNTACIWKVRCAQGRRGGRGVKYLPVDAVAHRDRVVQHSLSSNIGVYGNRRCTLGVQV